MSSSFTFHPLYPSVRLSIRLRSSSNFAVQAPALKHVFSLCIVSAFNTFSRSLMRTRNHITSEISLFSPEKLTLLLLPEELCSAALLFAYFVRKRRNEKKKRERCNNSYSETVHRDVRKVGQEFYLNKWKSVDFELWFKINKRKNLFVHWKWSFVLGNWLYYIIPYIIVFVM